MDSATAPAAMTAAAPRATACQATWRFGTAGLASWVGGVITVGAAACRCTGSNTAPITIATASAMGQVEVRSGIPAAYRISPAKIGIIRAKQADVTARCRAATRGPSSISDHTYPAAANIAVPVSTVTGTGIRKASAASPVTAITQAATTSLLLWRMRQGVQIVDDDVAAIVDSGDGGQAGELGEIRRWDYVTVADRGTRKVGSGGGGE